MLHSHAFLSQPLDCTLQRTQNAAARLITNARPRDHITLRWLPIKSRVVYKLCLQMHLIYTNQCSDYMADMVQLTAASSSRPGLRSASLLLNRKHALKTKFGERAFSHAGPAAWINLPDYIQSDLNTTSLKNNLKHIFLHLRFNDFIIY